MNTGTYANHYAPLSVQDLEAIHQASMQVLARGGFKIDNEKALKLFKESGANVDFEKNLVRLDENLVMELVKKAPSKVILYGREERHTMVVEPSRTFFGTGGTALNVIDRNSGLRRPAVTSDIAEIGRLVDALENIHWFCLPIYPTEKLRDEADLARFYHGLKNTGKHIMGGIYGSCDGAMNVIRLAQAVAGGSEELRRRPLVSVICSTISPLRFETRYVNFIFELVEAGIPVATSCAPIAGATAPVTLAGTLVQVNAEALCGVMLAQVIKENSPVLYSTVPTTANMRTMDFLFGPVENGMMNAACAQMASYYNLPMYSTGGVTESKLFDTQNGYEKSMNNLLPAMAGAQLIHNAAGLIDSSMTVAYEQYVIDDEILGMALRVLKGITITPRTLAVDEICAAGPGGNHLASDFTVEHMRKELYMPRTAVRQNYSAWVREGSRGAVEHARQVAEEIITGHQVAPFEKELESELEEMFPQVGTLS